MLFGYILLSLASCALCNPWADPLPKPQSIDWLDEDVKLLDPNLSLVTNCTKNVVRNAFSRATDTIFSLRYYPATHQEDPEDYEPFPSGTASLKKRDDTPVTISTVELSVVDETADLQMGVDESYNLTVGDDKVSISAGTVWGALYAFTTLQQLVIYNATTGFYIEGAVDIVDYPLYEHRGVMIDSGRNYLYIDTILQNIEMMSLAKLNVLHWHLEDAQSWPIQMESLPEMQEDSYTSYQQYSPEMLDEVVTFAKGYGVRVIPELDMPGHSNAGWEKADPDAVACGKSWWSNDVYLKHTANEPPPGQLDIIYNGTYDLVEKVYNEVSSHFDDDVFHVGMDELQDNCYNFSSYVQDWFAENTTRTYNDLLQYWVDKALPIFLNDTLHPNRTLMAWEDVVISSPHASDLPKDKLILQSWNGASNLKNLTEAGYKVVVSNSDWLYLDCGYGGWVTNDPRYADVEANYAFNYGQGGSWCAPYKTWQRIYTFNFTSNLTESESSLIAGAEACLWSEQADSTVMIQKIWPRAAALSELVWSGNLDDTGMMRVSEMAPRILNFREYLVAQGFPASPLVPQYCLQHPHACDLYLNQTIFDAY